MVREADYSIKDVLYIFKRRKMVFLLVFAAVMAGVFLFLFMAPKKYEAFMILQYNNAEDSRSDVSSSLASLLGSGGKSGENGISNEIQKMKSDDILGILVDKYDLVNSTNNSPSLYMRLIGKKVNKRDMIDSMKKDIVITYHRPDDIVENTSLLRISYKSSDRNFAYSVVKTLYEEYLKKDLIGYQKKSQDNIEKIYALYSQYSSEYEDISKQIIKFRMDNKISSDPSSFANNSLFEYYGQLYSKILTLDERKTQIDISLKSIEDNFIKADRETKELLLMNDSTIASTKRSIIENKIKLETLRKNSPNATQIPLLESEIETQEEFLQELINNYFKSNEKLLLGMDYNTYKEYISLKIEKENQSVLKEVYASIMKKLELSINQQSKTYEQLFDLSKKQAENELKYKSALNVLENEKIKSVSYATSFTVMDDVFVPEREIYPSKKSTVLLGFVLAVFAAMAVSLTVDFNDKKVHDLVMFSKTVARVDFIISKKRRKIEELKVLNSIKTSEKNIVGITYAPGIKIHEHIDEMRKILRETSLNFTDLSGLSEKDTYSAYDLLDSNVKSVYLMDECNGWKTSLFSGKCDCIYILVKEKSSLVSDFARFYNDFDESKIKIVYLG